MRNVLLGLVCLLPAGSLVAGSATCSQPNLVVSGIQGEMLAPCAGAIDFVSASYGATGGSPTGGGAASNTPGALKVVKNFDKSTPALMNACASGQHIQKVTLSYPSGSDSVTINFKDVWVSSVNESVNPTNESVEFKYLRWEIITGGTHTIGNVLGSARASSMNVAVVGLDGNSSPANHIELTVRPGGTTFNSIQLSGNHLAPNSRGAMRAGMMKTSAPSAMKISTPTPNLSNGAIEFRSANGAVLSRFEFTGGTLLNGNLRVQRVNMAPNAAAIHVR